MRIFVKATQFHESFVHLTSDQHHHLSRVLRIKKNEYLDVVVDEQVCKLVRFLRFQDNQLYFDKVSNQSIHQFPVEITLIQGLPKQDKFTDIVDAVTQCGVDRISPIVMERTIVKWENAKATRMLDRWRNRALQAAMQSKLMKVPSVDPVRSFSAWIQDVNVDYYDMCIVCWEGAVDQTLVDIVTNKGGYKRLCLVVGPEGGISEQEVQQLKSKGFKIISLGFNIFRVEIAGIVALSQIMITYNKK